MENLFGALILISLLCFFLSWIIPNTFSPLFKNKLSKGKIRLVFGLSIIVFFVLFGITSDNKTPSPENKEAAISENKQPTDQQASQQTEQKPVVAETKSEAPVQQTPQPTQAVFDVPSLIGKNIDEVKKVLGEPTEFLQPTKQQLALMDIWDMSYTKDDTNLLVTYNPKNKVVSDFFIDGSDKAKLLALGNLQEKSDAYIAEFVKVVTDPSKITGVKVSKKLPDEMDAGVTYSTNAFKIENKEDYGWTNCKFELNGGGKIFSGGYEFTSSSGIKAKDSLIISFSDFTKDSQRFNYFTEKPENLFIACDTNGQHRTNYFAIK